MPMIIVDDLAQPAQWQALAPDGITPSTELSMVLDTGSAAPGGAASSVRLRGSNQALDVSMRRSLAALDLTSFDELRFWIKGQRPADGSATRPFYLEFRLASAAVALGSPLNTWQRYLPVGQPGTWRLVRLSLTDLPPAIRQGVTTLQLRCTDATVAFGVNIDRLIAVREAMISDVDAALHASLDGRLSIGGAQIPAVLQTPGITPGTVPAVPRPRIEILQFDAQFAPERTDAAPVPGDYTDRGYALRPGSNAYELRYQITAAADDRPTQATMLEFILRAVPARGQLVVNGAPLPLEAIAIAPVDQIGGHRDDQIPLFYRVSTRQETGPGTLVQTPRNVRVAADLAAT